MQKIFNLTNKYIILTTVLILYSLISNIYAAIFAVNNGGIKLINLLSAILILILMTSAFLAGWLKMIKTAVVEPEKDEPNSLIKVFPEGVGEYILPVLGLGLQITVIWAIIGVGIFLLGNHLAGNPNLDLQKLLSAGNDMSVIKDFLSTLTPEQISKLAIWNHLFLSGISFGYFIVFLSLPALFFKNKNPFFAYFISLKDLLSKKFFKTLGVFLLILFSNVILSSMSVIFGANIILGFITTLAGFYVLTASAIGLFEYYYNNFVISHLGRNVDIKV